MAKAIVLVEGKRLLGVYSNKTNMWKKLTDLEGSEETLLIKTSDTTVLNCSYNNMVRYIKQWTMIRLYSKKDYNDGIDVINLTPKYRIWETIINEDVQQEL